MENSKKICMTLISRNQNQKYKADQLAKSVLNKLGKKWVITDVINYPKFENSYKIELERTIENCEFNILISELILISGQILKPWMVYLQEEDEMIELIFNKSDNSIFSQLEFNVIQWGHVQII